MLEIDISELREAIEDCEPCPHSCDGEQRLIVESLDDGGSWYVVRTHDSIDCPGLPPEHRERARPFSLREFAEMLDQSS